jgi:hypothetical protein
MWEPGKSREREREREEEEEEREGVAYMIGLHDMTG